MSTIISNDKHYKQIAEKLRKSLGTTIGYKPSEMPSAVLSLTDVTSKYDEMTRGVIFYGNSANMVGTEMYSGMFAGSNIQTFEVPENVTAISPYAFCGSAIENVVLHGNITDLKTSCFQNCKSLKSISLPDGLTSIWYAAFYVSGIEGKLVIPSSVTSISYYTFASTKLSSVEISSSFNIAPLAFWYSRQLKTVILRNESSINVLNDTDAFESTPIASGTGYIYVPSALLETYKTASNWSTYADQFRTLEDYTVDGTVTGEFDYSKI